MAELLRYTQEWHHQQQDIHPSDYIEEITEHNEIAELSSNLLALFKEIVLALSKQTKVPRDAQISIERSYSALILWSDGFGIAQGRLNDTFNKSRKLRYTALKNLLHIGRVLVERLVPAVNISSEKLKGLCSSVELNIEAAAGLIAEESCRQSDDSSSDAASNFSDDDIYEIAEDLKTDTLVLSGLDPLLKYPIFDSQHEHFIESQGLPIWGPEKSYSDKIGNRFPRADVSLTLYLGRANYERFLRCQEARESQEEEEEEPLAIVNQAEGTQAGTIIANTKFHDSGVGTSIGLTMSYAETTMSYNHDGQSVRIPPLPKEAKAGAPFTCIVCGRTVIITNNSAWKQHIYLDLRPYMCLDLSCPYSSSTFENRDNWLSHLALDHEMGPEWVSTECPLCKEETGNGKIAITKHLSKHLEEISLSALPVEVDSDAESENSLESSDANSSRNEKTYGGIEENGETLSVEFEAELASTVFSHLKDKVKAERNHKAQSEARGALQRAAEILAAREAENMVAQLKKTQENIEEMLRKKEKSKMAELAPIKFKDAVGREFSFPVHLCSTWQGLDDLIQQAFSQVDILGPHVQEGHYDLTDPEGNIILPSVWEEVVEPGLHITMNLWPLDKAPVAGLDPKESEKPHEEEGSSEKDSSFQNSISSKQQQEAQHSDNVQGARIIRMSGQIFFSTAKAYFKDQPDKFTRFRVILADIATTEWVPEAWRRSCFECRMIEAECDAKAPDPCTRCRLKKLSCAVQFAAVSRQHTVVNGDQIRQGIINIGRLCEGYPSFMHELNSVMPTGYRVEVLDASTVRFFAPDNEPTILQAGMPGHLTTGLDIGPNQQGESIPKAPNKSTLVNQNSSEAATTQQKETSQYFAQPTESRRTAYHAADTLEVSELAHIKLDKATISAHSRSKSVPLSHAVNEARSVKFGTWGLGPKGVSEDWEEDFEFDDSANRNDGAIESFANKIEQRFIDSPHISSQLLEVLRDAQNGTRSTENAYMVAKELFGSNSDLMSEFHGEFTKLDVDLLRRLRGALNDNSEAPREASIIKGDNIRTQEVMATVNDKNGPNDSNEPQYCICNKGSAGIMIRCDNVDSCKHKWFHLGCVGLVVAPSSKDKWYCPDCRGHVNIGEKADLNLQGLPPDPRDSEPEIDAEDATANLTYLENLAKFHKQLGTTMSRLPYVDKKPLDLYRLKTLVESRGGFDKVCKSKQWAEIGKDLGYSGKIMSSLSTSLKNSFQRWLFPYEEYLRLAKPGVQQQLEQEHVGTESKEKAPSIGRINYPFPNPDIYIWPPDSNVPGEKGSEPASSSTIPPPLLPPVMTSSDSSSNRGEGYNGEQYQDVSLNQYRTAVSQPRHSSSLAYDLHSGGVVPAGNRGRRSYMYGPGPEGFGGVSLGEGSRYFEALRYQEGVRGAPMPLTAQSLRKTSKRGELASNRSTRSSGSHDESDYKRSSHTTDLTTQSSAAHDEDFTIKVSGQAVVKISSTQIECDGGEITFSSNRKAEVSKPRDEIDDSQNDTSGEVIFPCEAEPQEKRTCLKQFGSIKVRNRHYCVSHKDYAIERGILGPMSECPICGTKFTRRDNLKRHIKNHHSTHKKHGEASQDSVGAPSEELPDLDLDPFAGYFDQLEEEILEDETKIQEREKKWENILRMLETSTTDISAANGVAHNDLSGPNAQALRAGLTSMGQTTGAADGRSASNTVTSDSKTGEPAYGTANAPFADVEVSNMAPWVDDKLNSLGEK